jgi:hypothetical protein
VVEGTSEDGLHHEALLVGLVGEEDYVVQVDSVGEGGRYQSERLPLRPEPLPDALPDVGLWQEGDSAGSGFSLTVILQYPDAVIALLDSQGQYVWWQEVEDVGALRALFDPATQSVSYVGRASGGGKALWRCALDGVPEELVALPSPHHDIKLDPAGGWYVITYDERVVTASGEVLDPGEEGGDDEGDDEEGGDDDEERGGDDEDEDSVTVLGDAVLHVSPDGRSFEVVWSSWDEFPYAGSAMSGVSGLEYPHTNSLDIDAETGDLLLSLYLADAIVRVDPTSGRSRWVMGGERSDWRFDDGEGFSRQHSPLLLDGGSRLALFDNGDGGEDGAFAEAVIYALDPDTLRARREWAYSEGGVHQRVTMGSVVPTEGGGALVSWGSDATLSRVTAEGQLQSVLALDGLAFGYTDHLSEVVGRGE